jgi:PAS domain S-box-containing protein
MSDTEIQESVWIEIIRRMEGLYAQLADSQSQIERHALELAEAKELADNVIKSMNDALVTLDSGGRMTLVNEAGERFFGVSRDQIVGRDLGALLRSDAEKWRWGVLSRRMRQEGAIRDVETNWRNGQGTLVPVAVSCVPLRDVLGDLVGAVLIVRDMHEIKRRMEEARAATEAAAARAMELEKVNSELQLVQAELVQAAKMSSIGRLAAGVAHELNNPLGGILLYSDLLLEDTPEGDARRPNVAKIAALADRCRQVVRGLLDFARPAAPRDCEVDVNNALKSSLAVLEGQESFHNVTVAWKLDDRLRTLVADPNQLQQAFTNVLVNAAEAMSGSGTLTIETCANWLGDGVLVKISDTGCGIPREHLDRLFEPFFTTKDGGTGLGLAITYSIVERHNGSMDVHSEVGKGTTFTIALRGTKGMPRNA